MADWRFIRKDVALAIHLRQLEEHGGAAGVRDEGLLDSALARSENPAAYGGDPDVFDLAAAYAAGVIQNHPFVDGNKRVGLVLAELFLHLNGAELVASDEACVLTTFALAAGEIDLAAFAAWAARKRDGTTLNA